MRNHNYTLVFGITQKFKYFYTFLEEVLKTVGQDSVSDNPERNEGTKSRQEKYQKRIYRHLKNEKLIILTCLSSSNRIALIVSPIQETFQNNVIINKLGVNTSDSYGF